MITKEKILNRMKKDITGKDDQKDNLFAYITGQIDEVPKKLNTLRIKEEYGFQLVDGYFEPEENMDDEAKVYVNRFIFALSKIMPATLIHFVNIIWSNDIVPGYCKAQVEDEFIRKLLVNNLFKECEEALNRGLGQRFKTLIETLAVNYPKVAEDFICETELKGTDYIGTLVFLAREIKEHPKSAHIEKMESLMLSCMIKIFGLEKVRKVYEEYGTQGFPETVPQTDIADCEALDEVLNLLTGYFVESQGSIKEMAKLTVVLYAQRDIEQNKSSYGAQKELENICTKLEVPNEVYIYYYMNQSDGRDHVVELASKNLHKTQSLIKKWINQGSLYGVELIGIVLSYNLIKEGQEELLALAEQVIVKWAGKRITPFDEMDFKSLDCDITQLSYAEKYQQADWHMSRWISAYVGLMPYLPVCVNYVKLFLEKQQEYCLESIDLVKTYMTYRHIDKEKAVEELYHKGISMRIFLIVLFGERRTFTKQEIDENVQILHKYSHDVEEVLKNMPYENDHFIITLLECFYEDQTGFSAECLVYQLESTNMVIALKAEELLRNKEAEAKVLVEEMAKSKKRMVKEAALRLLRKWDNDHVADKVKNITSLEALEQFVAIRYTKQHKIHAIYQGIVDYSKVRSAKGEGFVSDKIIKYYVAEYMLINEFYEIKLCEKIVEMVNRSDLQQLIEGIYTHWVEEGTKPCYKNIMYPFSLLGEEKTAVMLKKQIDEWSKKPSKTEMAAFGVQCLALNESQLALLAIDNYAKTSRRYRIQRAAENAVERLCKEKHLSKDMLEDLIVPDFGFNSNRERFFDYGNRLVKVILNDDCSLKIVDEAGKVLRNLPKASEKYGDIEEKVKVAKDQFKLVKKELPEVVKIQKIRMIKALYTSRNWDTASWKALFMQNPLMIQFASGLIWQEVSEEGKLTGTFRYLKDGILNGLDEEKYVLNEGSRIMLAHPCDLGHQAAEWKAQLENYEIQQPISQLDLDTGDLEENQLDQVNLAIENHPDIYFVQLKSIMNHIGAEVELGQYGECMGWKLKDEKNNIILRIKLVESEERGNYKQKAEIKYFRFEKNREGVPLANVAKRFISLCRYIEEKIKISS